MAAGWLRDGTEQSLRSVLASCAPELARLPLRINPRHAASNPLLAVMAAYEQLSGRRVGVDRVMAWHALTALGDAMWRTEAGVPLPGGGTAATYVDRLSRDLAALELDR